MKETVIETPAGDAGTDHGKGHSCDGALTIASPLGLRQGKRLSVVTRDQEKTVFEEATRLQSRAKGIEASIHKAECTLSRRQAAPLGKSAGGSNETE